jgi:hypothetical protein
VDLSSFSLSDIQYVRARNTNIKLDLLASSLTNLSAVAALAPSGMSLEHATLLANPSWVATVMAAGCDVAAWTVNTVAKANSVAALGVRRIISDYDLRTL